MLTVENLIKSYQATSRNAPKRSTAAPAGDASTKVISVAKANAAQDRAPVNAIDDISFTVEEGEFFTLLGPSGCGKTTTLRSVAGLERPNSGRISVDGRVFFEGDGIRRPTVVPANQRALGMVFQSYAIWPHMTVFQNAAFPLTVAKRNERLGKAAIKERVDRALATMELSKFADRRATQLSGGQQQRLALARALVIEPRLLLLDEPLSNLDAKLRESLRFELKRLQHELGITTVYVTHDQDEALSMSTKIAVMSTGKIAQIGRPQEIYERPANRFVAEFIGASNFVDGTVLERGADVSRIQTSLGVLTTNIRSAALPATKDVRLQLRPEALRLYAAGQAPSSANSFAASVRAHAYRGDSIDHVVFVNEQRLQIRTNAADAIAPGADAVVVVDPRVVTVVPA